MSKSTMTKSASAVPDPKGSGPNRPPPIDPYFVHSVERAAYRALTMSPWLTFSDLVVRRIPNGICIEGVLEVTEEDCDVTSLVRTACGVQEVLNRLVIHHAPLALTTQPGRSVESPVNSDVKIVDLRLAHRAI